MMKTIAFFFAALFAVIQFIPSILEAKESDFFRSNAVAASLITATDGVVPGAKTLSAGFRVDLAEGWKTYWRTPGEVGTPPTIDWSGSQNVANVTFLWPAPSRFHAFGIENFGYKHEVVFPLSIELQRAGQPVKLRGRVNMLTCSLVCIPQDFELSLDLNSGGDLDPTAAKLIAEWADRVPASGQTAGVVLKTATLVSKPETSIVFTVQGAKPFTDPDIFPEVSRKTTFGPPDIRLGDRGRLLWARVPLTNLEDGATGLAVTITDGDTAVSISAIPFGDVLPDPPYDRKIASPGVLKLMQMALIALIGGLILNVMPCVLPVLSIKLASAVKIGAHASARVRAGFLMSAAGVMAFMWGLAGVLIALRWFGVSVGWGVQFQSPIFLVAMTVLLVFFAANFFGFFEINLPSRLTNRLAAASGKPTLLGDFSTGAFGAVLATPCSAPFLGTAVAFSLAGRAFDIVVIFSALGVGLALPYFLVAIKPGLVAVLPRPGRWMVALKAVLGFLLIGTAAWLLWVLNGVAGSDAVFAVTILLVLASGTMALRLPGQSIVRRLRGIAVIVFAAAAIAVPVVIAPAETGVASIAENQKIAWLPFDRASIAKRVSQGEVVFLDITADWCITCKANKALVINRSPVADILNGGSVTPMQADWTRPDERISKFLADHDRYGIPFNAVYGPLAPDGVLLPELLTTEAVLDALRTAGGDAAVAVIAAD